MTPAPILPPRRCEAGGHSPAWMQDDWALPRDFWQQQRYMSAVAAETGIQLHLVSLDGPMRVACERMGVPAVAYEYLPVRVPGAEWELQFVRSA